MPDEPVSTNEIADLLNVDPRTVHSWRNRGRFPEPDLVLSATPIWWKSTVTQWAKTTGKEMISGPDSSDLAELARISEEDMRALPDVLRNAQTHPSAGWIMAFEGIADRLPQLAHIVAGLARAQEDSQRVEQVDWLKNRAREAIDKAVEDRFDNWAHLNRSERQGLAHLIFNAAMMPSIHYEYIVDPDGDGHVLHFGKKWAALRISADGKELTLERIGEAHSDLVDDVRAWDVWRRIRPGPI